MQVAFCVVTCELVISPQIQDVHVTASYCIGSHLSIWCASLSIHGVCNIVHVQINSRAMESTGAPRAHLTMSFITNLIDSVIP